jgi:nucleoside-diphosphate kinase
MERTLVVLKPDAVQRGLVGEIVSRFEKVGLKIVGAKMFKPDKDLGNKHYPKERKEWVEGLGGNTLRSYKEQGLDVKEQFKTDDPYEIGLAVHKWLVEAEFEINLWFKADELFDYETIHQKHMMP